VHGRRCIASIVRCALESAQVSKLHSCNRSARRNNLRRYRATAPRLRVELDLDFDRPPIAFQNNYAAVRARLTAVIQLRSITASTVEELSKRYIRAVASSEGSWNQKKCAQIECADVCGCSFFHVLHPQARDRSSSSMSLPPLPTRKVRGTMFLM
jgi:hypothetical protein